MRPARPNAVSLFPRCLYISLLFIASLVFVVALLGCAKTAEPGQSIGELKPDSPRSSLREPVWAGRWEGELSDSRTLVRLEISDQHGGRLSMPREALYDLGLQELSLGRSRIRFELPLTGQYVTFRGKLRDQTINGRFLADRSREETGGSTQLVGEIAFERIPRKDVPYREEEVSFRGGSGILSGTLTLPAGQDPFPAAVLISPGGPHNRDAEIRGFPLFALLADLLTRRGIAVLRYDDRGIGRSQGRFASAGPADFADDAGAGAAYLMGRQDIRSVGYIGHGEGGLAAIHAATQEGGSPPYFLVLLSTPFRDFPLLSEIRELSCPLLSIWGGGEEPAGESHHARLLQVLEESDIQDYTAVRLSEGDECFLMDGPSFTPRFREFLVRWLSSRTG